MQSINSEIYAQRKIEPGIRDLQKITGFPNFTSTNSYKKKQSSSMFPGFHKWLQFPNSMTDATNSTYSKAAINYHQASP
jgi:hypothetical protein